MDDWPEGFEGASAQGGGFGDAVPVTALCAAGLVEPGLDSGLPVLSEVVVGELCGRGVLVKGMRGVEGGRTVVVEVTHWSLCSSEYLSVGWQCV